MITTDAIPLLTFDASDAGVAVDLDTLITSKMLIQANSGGGKSWMLRYLLEQTHGQVQQIVFDPEGEFASLREHFPYVLAGVDGDVPAQPESAAVLCRRLMELGVSAVLDLYELELEDRALFVKNFLTELMRLPRALWRPLLVVIDEAQVFCPEKGEGEAVSKQSVISVCTRGRKRGYCPVLAVQRISQLNKNAAAELNNKLIGRTGLDIDIARAAATLGFDRERRQTLPYLSSGVFYAFGPAISREVVEVRSGTVRTTHPEPGRVAPPAPPPPEQLRQVLAQLTDVAGQAVEEVEDLGHAQQRIADLERQLQLAGEALAAPPERVEVPVLSPDQIDRLDASIADLRQIAGEVIDALGRVQPTGTHRQLAQELVSMLKPTPAGRSRTQRSTAGRRAKPGPAKSPSKPAPQRTTKRADRARQSKPAAGDAIARTLAIRSIASKVERVRNRFKGDSTTQGYVRSTLRTLWNQTLRPEDIAAGRGSNSPRTIERLTSVCRALEQEELVIQKGDAGYTVDQDKIRRLVQLSQAVT